jgi:hypothetical protein
MQFEELRLLVTENTFDNFYTGVTPQAGTGETVYKGRRVHWIGERGRTFEIPARYVFARSDNIFDENKLKAVEEKIRNSLPNDPTILETPLAHVDRLSLIDIYETRCAYLNDRLSTEYGFEEPWSGGEDLDDMIDNPEYLTDLAQEYAGEEVLWDELVEITPTKETEDRPYVETVDDSEEAVRLKGMLENHIREIEDSAKGDIGQYIAQLRDGNHRGLGAINSGEEVIYVKVTNNSLQDAEEDLKKKLI